MSKAELARACNVQPPSVSAWESGDTKIIDGPNLLLAATALQCKPEWIIHGHPADAPRPQEPVTEAGDGRFVVRESAAASWLKKGIVEIQIPLLDVAGSMGAGVPLMEHVNVVEMISANVHELKRRVSFSAAQNLRLITGYGDSMSPTFNDGDVLLVDLGVTELKLEAVYTLQRDGDLFIKRIQRLGEDRFLMISDNPLYKPIEINLAEDRYEVLARVVCVWNMRKL